MKIVELINKVALPITNEEAELLDQFQTDQPLTKSQLNPRQQVVANQLVNKDVLYRIQENGRISYKKKVS